MEKEISYKDCIAFGWRTFKARPWFFVVLSLIICGVSVASGIVQGMVIGIVGKSAGDAISFLISVPVNALVGMGFTAVYLKAHDAVMSPTYSELWHPQPFWKYLGAYLLLMIILVVGFVLLIVPGVILCLIFMFTMVLVIERGLGPVEALQESARLTKGHRWELFYLMLAIVGINILGMLAVMVGLFVSIPVTILATIHAYRILSASTPVSHLDTPAPIAVV